MLSFYKFFEVTAPSDLRDLLLTGLQVFRTRGLMILATEGVNATLAFPSLEERLRAQAWLSDRGWGLGPRDFKISDSARAPFADELKIKMRTEIVTALDPDLHPPGEHGEFHLSPEKWQRTLESGEEVVLIDTRNWYESELGTFRNAITPPLEEFSEFKSFAGTLDLPKDQKILMFCTGGIRCEKASLQMNELGYQNVYQLEGGILAYIEQFPDQAFQGECFVFDGRVAVDQRLLPTRTYGLCWSCGQPGSKTSPCVRCENDFVICEKCTLKASAALCSKNCSYHWSLHPGRKGTPQRAKKPDQPLTPTSQE